MHHLTGPFAPSDPWRKGWLQHQKRSTYTVSSLELRGDGAFVARYDVMAELRPQSASNVPATTEQKVLTLGTPLDGALNKRLLQQ